MPWPGSPGEKEDAMKTAICPSCNKRKYSAAKSSDGLCDECGGRSRPPLTPGRPCDGTANTNCRLCMAVAQCPDPKIARQQQ
jgi:hypothetical protein